jgi:hypothetical protein
LHEAVSGIPNIGVGAISREIALCVIRPCGTVEGSETVVGVAGGKGCRQACGVACCTGSADRSAIAIECGVGQRIDLCRTCEITNRTWTTSCFAVGHALLQRAGEGT